MSDTDPVRLVLANLIAESGSYKTPESILREFRATRGSRKSDNELVSLLRSISRKRPNCQEVLDEIKQTLERMDPMFALLLFTERHSDEDSVLRQYPSSSRVGTHRQHSVDRHSSTRTSADIPLPHSRSNNSLTSQLQDRPIMLSTNKSQDFPTSTPLSQRKPDNYLTSPTMSAISTAIDQAAVQGELRVIKERVLSAVSSSSLTSQRSLSNANVEASPKETTLKPIIVINSKSMGSVFTCFPDECRTHGLWDFYKVEGGKPAPDLIGIPIETQQRELITELIYCLMGVRGDFIVPLESDPKADGIGKYETHFSVDKNVDKSLAELALEILPLASHYIGIQRIVSATQEHGQVCSALNSALEELTRDYYVLLAQIEQEHLKDHLTMQKMLYYLRPTILVMEEIWASLTEMHIENYTGAAVLTHLCACIKRLEGDKPSQEALISLTKKASVPYMRVLQRWIQKGIIVDRHQEFLVEDNEGIRCDELPELADYWEKRYSVRRDRIPSFLEKYSDKILRTGKYLNVIRQCGKRVMPTQEMNLQFDPTNEQHVFVINDAYYFAARMLLDVLLTENDLMGHLQSVKRYLLLNQGDFIMQFMDACEDELAKNVDLVLPMTLENLLGLTLRLSSARNDPYKDDLHCELLTYDLVTQMSKIMNKKEEYWQDKVRLDLSGLECFAFRYDVKWPVSLVLNHIAISKYQMIFRQLFYCKHVERQLCKIWKENAITKKFSPHAAELYRSAFTLRQRMMNAIQNLEYYMMIEIIEPNWHIFIEKMKKVENVDNVLSLHQDFLDLCLKNCMLTESSHLNRAIFKLCKICLGFCEFIQCESSLDQADTFGERVKRFDLEFTGLLISFLKQINDLAKDNTTDRFLNLVHRINFNSFYSDQIEKLCVKKAMG
ncbi:gamma-tubulin complex component 2 homolog isoform X2 [Scaptodrosophila lebanonensis]|uniref:Gamma-tubulin complex component n=1 Tax=Drosophila lebanonensis TaxID=7225 RepID=A0A6J2U4N7_DROLE|nr:gamma-tubulin complex component 2 homolog isoform X2 [Scaptodrosophila lebanonensis]